MIICDHKDYSKLIVDYTKILIQDILRSESNDPVDSLLISGLVPIIFKYRLFQTKDKNDFLINGANFKTLKKHMHLVLARSTLIEFELKKVISFLNSKEIIPILLKGSDLGIWLYGDFFLREMDDIDFLVEPEAFASACSEMKKQGYRVLKSFNGAHITFIDPKDGAIPIELHKSLYRRDVFLHDFIFKGKLDDNYLKRATEINISGLIIKVLHWDDRLEYLCFHFIKHGLKTGKWALDLLLLFHINLTKKMNSEKSTALKRITLNIISDFFRSPDKAYRLRMAQKLSEFSLGRALLFLILNFYERKYG